MTISSTPVLELPSGINIGTITSRENGVFLGLSDGRILWVDAIYSNAYLTAGRSLYAQIEGVLGAVSEIGWSNLMYRLSNYLINLNNGVVENSYKVTAPLAATQSNDIVGIFTTPVLWGGSDFGYWDNLVYNQTVPQDASVKIGVRVGKTVAEVMSSAWMYFEYQGASITQDLAHFNTKGSYIQVQVSMRTTIANVTPKVSSLTLSYQTKYAVYLFSRTFTLDPLTNLKSGLVTANITVPPNTEVRFGITGKNSSEWNDYTLINLDKSFTLPASIKDQFKVGVKMMASSVVTSSTIDGIALMLSGDVDNEINQLYQSSSSSSSSSSMSS